ncbi:MAG: hypothetical protein QXR53_03010 [Candidatus Norongarragalinales archaeon]
MNAKLIFLALGAVAIAAGVFLLTQTPGQAPASCDASARNSLPPNTFDNLPDFPRDFCEKVGDLRSRKITLQGFSELGEAYWRQPELQPNFESYAIQAMLNPPEGRWAANGYGSYPADFVVELKHGQSWEGVFFFKSSWLVESYQGIALNHIILHANESVFKGKQSIRVSYSPDEFLLGPAYPVFDENWVEKISLGIKLDEGTPPGEYLVLLNVKSPKRNGEWAGAYPHYFDASSFGLQKPFLRIRLFVKS